MFELWETNAGVDGWDAKTQLVAYFTTVPKAMAWLDRRGYTYPEHNRYAHKDAARRHCMGQLTYEIKPQTKPTIEVDPT